MEAPSSQTKRRPRISLLSLLTLVVLATSLGAVYATNRRAAWWREAYRRRSQELEGRLWEQGLRLGWGVDSDSPYDVTVNPVERQNRVATDTERWAWRFTVPHGLDAVEVRLSIKGDGEVKRRFRIEPKPFWHSVSLESYFGRESRSDEGPRAWQVALVIDDEVVFISNEHKQLASALSAGNCDAVTYPSRAFQRPPISLLTYPGADATNKTQSLELSIEPLPATPPNR